MFCVWPIKKNSESTHGKSLGIHQREQKNNPWHSRSQVVWFICGLSNHKSSSTNRAEENCKYRKPQHMLRWIRGRYPVTYLIQDTRRQAWRTFEVHSEYILHVFAPNTLIIWVPLVRHGFVIVFFFCFLTVTLDQKMVIKMRRCITVTYFREVESKREIRNHHHNQRTLLILII